MEKKLKYPWERQYTWSARALVFSILPASLQKQAIVPASLQKQAILPASLQKQAIAEAGHPDLFQGAGVWHMQARPFLVLGSGSFPGRMQALELKPWPPVGSDA